MIARLTECYERDLLDVDELDRLLDQAHAASTCAELDLLVAGLGEGPASLRPLVHHATNDPARLDKKFLTVMFSHVERTGRWVVPRTLIARLLFGNVVLDFRDASMAAGTTTLDLSSSFGTIELLLPPWLAIDVDVASIGGAVEERHRIARDPDPDEPVLLVTGIVRFGNLCISTRLPGETRGEARKREQRERREVAARRALPAARGQM
ncbi:MAG TPA: hypothetical protein VIV40_35120 [Kofleriaceae bacterium]